MQIYDFDSSHILESGFRADEPEDTNAVSGAQICIYCGERVPADQQKKHASRHGRQEKFDLLLNADSVFAFTAKEKSYLYHVFAGLKDKEIAQKMGIPEVSARRMRNQFNNRMRQARGLLLLDELLGDSLKRRKKKKPESERTRIPSLDEAGNVLAFYPTKRTLHEAGLLHPTSILVVYKRDPKTGEPAFLVVDKADKLGAGDDASPVASALDVLGGHVREEDFPLNSGASDAEGAFAGKPIPVDPVLWNCARRELARELVSPSQPEENLSLWFTNRYRGTHAEGTNNEISWVFFCRYTNGTQHLLNVPGEVRIKDDWIDSIGESVSRTYVGRFWRLGELIRQVDAHPEQANDGLKRVLKRLSEEPELLDKLE
ncbi:MAG: hypothetical protein VB091_08995 [Christensenella sp.]|nr:hypothetical protein [Christensenella sp.]